MIPDAQTIATIAAALITSGFFYGGVKFLFRSRAESGAIIVKSAEGVVVLQASIIKELKQENEELKKEIEMLKTEIKNIKEELKTRLKRHRDHIDKIEGGHFDD